MATIQGWTGYEAGALRKALRKSVRGFADHLGIGVGTISKWERLQGRTCPRPWMQEVLDTALARAPEDAQARFYKLIGTSLANTEATAENQAGDGHAAIDIPHQTGSGSVLVQVRIDGRDVVVPIDRRILLGAGTRVVLGSVADALPLTHSRQRGIILATPAQLDELLVHFREQWHLLVKTDNLLGPRYAIRGVLDQLQTIDDLLASVDTDARRHIVQVAAQYAESASWLYEDGGNVTQARYWTSRAMEWAYEGDDERMLAWTFFRRSQQVATTGHAAHVIGLAQAARRNEERLATPTRAAIRVQEAYGHALDGDEQASQRLLDEAHTWAASDTVGEARGGHGSYCTPSYIETQRANCWLTIGKPKKAITLYEESLRTLPAVYQRNRAAALSRLAAAYLADAQLEQAASTAHAALPVARSSGSGRTLEEIKGLSAELASHPPLPGVAALLDDLGTEDC